MSLRTNKPMIIIQKNAKTFKPCGLGLSPKHAEDGVMEETST